MSGDFAQQLLDWAVEHGRHDLPWQHPRTPYRVWVSEIMLQQTQVATVIDYFQRFMCRFPDIATLAESDQDDVLALWSGLGYYARGRNLHKTAQLCMQTHNGQLPEDVEALIQLPGIGKSTAHAILAQAHGQRLAILDANARRVLARFFGIAETAPYRKLWQCAQAQMPDNHIVAYTQAIMDFGAMVCRAKNPDCKNCPLRERCVAFAQDAIEAYPGKPKKKTKPTRDKHWLLLQSAESYALIRRPESGIWGGLWSLPEFDAIQDLQDALAPRLVDAGDLDNHGEITHSFTHFHLRAQVWRLQLSAPIPIMNAQWWTIATALKQGIPAPVRRLLQSCKT